MLPEVAVIIPDKVAPVAVRLPLASTINLPFPRLNEPAETAPKAVILVVSILAVFSTGFP